MASDDGAYIERLKAHYEAQDLHVTADEARLARTKTEAELARLRAENKRLREHNESVAVCAKHTADVVGTHCLVCENERLRDVAEWVVLFNSSLEDGKPGDDSDAVMHDMVRAARAALKQTEGAE